VAHVLAPPTGGTVLAPPTGGTVLAPPTGTVLEDARGGGRAMRVTWHQDAGCVVLSLWQAELCVGTFRLETADVPPLVATLVAGLAQTAAVPAP
jgi:hypothetical protein